VTVASDSHLTSSVSILDEELRSKIEENARLHKQVKNVPILKIEEKMLKGSF